MITRNEIYKWFKSEWGEMQGLFLSMSDQDLAKHYGLRVIRKGYFTR